MKLASLAVCIVILLPPGLAAEPQRKARSSVPGPYPSIIRIPPPDPAAPQGIIHSELGGRELQFLQLAHQAGSEQASLLAIARSRSESEQIKAVADALADTQTTESREIARLATDRKVTLPPATPGTGPDELGQLTGAKFEKLWIERLMAVNELSVTSYEVGARSTDAEIRSFAEKMLPVAQARLQMAYRLGGRSLPAKAAPASSPAGGRPQPIAPPITP